MSLVPPRPANVDETHEGTRSDQGAPEMPTPGAEQGIVRQLEALRQGISMRMLPGVTVEAPVAKQPARSSITCGRITLSTIPPESTFRLAWDAVGMFLGIVNAVFVPLIAAFFTVEEGFNGVFGVNIIIDVFFFVDMILNTITGFRTKDDEIVLSMKEVWAHYRRFPKGGLWVDVVTNIPLDYIMLGVAGFGSKDFHESRFIRYFRLLRLLKLMRLSGLLRYFSRAEEKFNISWTSIRFIKVYIIIFLIIHNLACFLYLQAVFHNFSPQTYVARNGIQGSPFITVYTYSVFAVVSQVSTCGYSVYPSGGPTLVSEQWVIICGFLIGTMSFVHVTGSFLAMTRSLHSPAAVAFKQRLYEIGTYMKRRNIAPDLRARVREYYYKRFNKRSFDEASILADLPLPLQRAIIGHNVADVIAAVPIFQQAHQGFKNAILPCLHDVFFLKGDLALLEGEPPMEVHFIFKGKAAAHKDDAYLTCMDAGSYFGDMAVLWDVIQPVSVTTITDCECYSISAEDFNTIMQGYPDVREVFLTIAQQRLLDWGIAEKVAVPAKSQCEAKAEPTVM